MCINPSSKVAAHHQAGLSIEHSVSYCSIVITGCSTKRADDKVTFPGLGKFMLFPPLNSTEESELKDSLGVKRAAVRKLQQELGINPAQINLDDFHFITKMMYSAE